MRGTITKYEGKKGTTYTVSYYAGIGPDGKKRYKTKRGFKKHKDAETYLAQVSIEVNTGVYTDPSQEKFADFVQKWLDYKKDYVRPRTVEVYARTMRIHVTPQIGHMKISELKPYHISELYTYLKRKSELSNRTINQIHNQLHDIFDRALKWEVVHRNIVDAVDAPKPERKRFTVWTLEQTQRFLNHAEVKNHRFYIAYLLALSTGMREGEIIALRWQDINFEDSTLHVQHTITQLDGKYHFGPPKSESGNRVITLPSEVIAELRKHKMRQNEQRLQMGQAYHNLDLVVARINGNFVSQSFLRYKFKDMIEKTGLPDIRFHDLRHTHASILLELKEDLKTIQERLGHATIGVTADIYTHVSKTVKERPAKLISDAFFSDK